MRNFLTLIFLLLISIFLRFYQLDKVPVHLNNDEISVGYDAYSVGRTLRDEHNNFLPLSFASHGVSKAPLYIYLTILPVKIFGNNEFAVRFVSAVSGVLTIFIFGGLVFLLSGSKSLSLLASFVLSLSPWHIYASRVAFECNLALALLSLGIFLFLLAQKSKKDKLFLILSAFSFGLSLYAYHTEWLLVPILAVFLPIAVGKKFTKKIFFWWFIISLFYLPVIASYLIDLKTTIPASSKMIWNEAVAKSEGGFWAKLVLLFALFANNYSSYFNLGNLFFNGLNLLPQKTPYLFGLLLFCQLPFLIIGLLKVGRFFPKKKLFIYFWFFLSPVIPSLTRGGVSFPRNLHTVLPICLLIATGLFYVWQKTGSLGKMIIFPLNIFCFALFFIFFFKHFPVYSGENWQYGYKQIAEVIKPIYFDYRQIIIDPRFGPASLYAGVPHLYIPFFTNLDPNALLGREVKGNGLYFDKYRIADIDWSQEIKEIQPDSLYILPESNLPPIEDKHFVEVRQIFLPNGKIGFRIFKLSE